MQALGEAKGREIHALREEKDRQVGEIREEVARMSLQLQFLGGHPQLYHTPYRSTPPVCFTIDNFSKLKSAKKTWTSPDLYSHEQGYKIHVKEILLLRQWCQCGCVCQAWRVRCSAEVAGQSLLHHTAPQPAQRPRPPHQRECGEGVGEANWRQDLLLAAFHRGLQSDPVPEE